MIFLIKPAKNSTHWQPASRGEHITTAVVWIEREQSYSYLQEQNPGPSLLMSLDISEAKLKSAVTEVTKNQSDLKKIAHLKNSTERAKQLRPFLDSKLYYPRKLAFEEMGKCGPAALPLLRAMLVDEKDAPHYDDIIKAMGAAGGSKVGAEMTRLVKTETRFWKQKTPYLKVGWWNGKGFENKNGVDWDRVEFFRNHYTKLYAALGVLEKIKYSPSRQAVSELRVLWMASPQFDDKSGLDQMSERCSKILEGLASAKKR